MLLAIDLDGVTIDLMSAWLEQYHPTYTKDDIHGWTTWNYILTCKGKEQFFYELTHLNPDKISLELNAANTIKKIIADGHTVFFLTSKLEGSMAWTRKVLEDWDLGDIPIINNHLDGKSKDDYPYDMLLDDCPHHDYSRTIIFAQPWNKDVKNLRVSGWDDFYSRLSKP